MNLDLIIFKLIHNLSGRSVCLDSIGIFLAEYLIWFFLIGIFLFLIFSKNKQKKELAIFSVLSLALFYLFNFVIGKIYFRPRPFIFFNFTPLVNVAASESSFPSAHTGLAFCLAFSVYFINKRLGLLFLILALLIGISRIFVGVHWPSDILAGIFFGLICVLVIKIIFKKILDSKS